MFDRCLPFWRIWSWNRPYALRDERERVLAFIAENALRYREGVQEKSYGVPIYLSGHDYFTRYDALDVVQLIGTVTDVPVVEKLIADGLQFDLEKIQYRFAGFGRRLRKYEQIQDKGRRIIEDTQTTVAFAEVNKEGKLGSVGYSLYCKGIDRGNSRRAIPSFIPPSCLLFTIDSAYSYTNRADTSHTMPPAAIHCEITGGSAETISQ